MMFHEAKYRTKLQLNFKERNSVLQELNIQFSHCQNKRNVLRFNSISLIFFHFFLQSHSVQDLRLDNIVTKNILFLRSIRN